MVAITLYDAYFPILAKTLNAADAVLTAGETHAKENSVDANAEYTEARLCADMYTLVQQIQTLTRIIKATVTLLTGLDPEDWPTDEKTFAELHARVQRTRELLAQVKPEAINGREDEAVHFEPLNIHSTVKNWLSDMALTNAFFHLTTAYGILRTKGVPLGKKSYLAPFL
ncbi:helix-turn-helix-domain-containing protein type, partial [Coniella lustricola]